MNLQFALNLPMEFRRLDADHWLSGHTEKMDSTGVLFRAAQSIEPDSRIEMVFRMPVADPCNLICMGTVLGVDSPRDLNGLALISATIDRYSFVRS